MSEFDGLDAVIAAAKVAVGGKEADGLDVAVPAEFVEYVAKLPELKPSMVARKVEFTVDGRLVVRDACESEDAYVAREVEITRRMIRDGLKDDDGFRLRRSEEYNRWRFRGWLVGDIGQLPVASDPKAGRK